MSHDNGMPRIQVGIPGFDVLVHGGLPKGRSTLLAGSTGTGKTVFGLQFLAEGARLGEPGVLVTFAERPEDLIANSASFGWGLDQLVRDGKLAIVDATPQEDESVVSGRFDLGGLAARITYAIGEVQATRMFLDPIDALFEEFDARNEVRHAFASMLRALRPMETTTLIAAERPSEDDDITRYGAEEFVVDNVVLMRNSRAAERRRRTVEVLKLRGAPHHKGEFPFVIDPSSGIGIVPFSPIEGAGGTSDVSSERVSFGNAELDAICGGGMYRDSLLMITGATGTGKTLIGLQFMAAGIAAGERVLYLSFEESEWQLERNANAWGMDLSTPKATGQLQLVSRYPARLGLEDLLVEIKHTVESFSPTRLVLDSMTAVEHNSPAKAFREFSVGLSAYLKGRGVATMMTTTLPNLLGGNHATDLYLSTIADAILALRYFDLDSEVRRAVLVLKVRGSGHAREMHEYEIGPDGMNLLGPISGVGGILAGQATHVGSASNGAGAAGAAR
ncbi:MAG: circadian clock protein KaiC [Solirubrobacteraceae bacterium]|nr:circadian clock protein KaiC [Solirubrobacteraceae bacterium]